jgi:hypothetical protein
MYVITEYTKKKAKAVGVEVRPSTRKGKKIDVFQEGKKIASIGDLNYKDYPTFLQEEGKAVADRHREQYYQRHTKTTAGEQLAKWLLW